mgnify:CR=1 FL=1
MAPHPSATCTCRLDHGHGSTEASLCGAECDGFQVRGPWVEWKTGAKECAALVLETSSARRVHLPEGLSSTSDAAYELVSSDLLVVRTT